ncbi:hypothetical protein FA15DRAFT_674380 [Coprinopsis marcescibilis]|uniref:Uncharacterized protein n=1 Tax=Coprinopsis marcescibilis TaxID=230819 RepID=A0A5C3KHZ6_COPMA|nr:hypothetical protein FA15DRAFT_674380 [Coprinopsis marcescibilis]
MSRDRGKGQKDQTMTESVETKVEERSDGMGPHVTEQLIDKTSLQRVETEDGVAMKVRFEHLERGVDTFHEVTRIFEDDNLVDVLERTVLHATQSLDGNDRSESPVGGLKEGQDDMVDTVDTDSPRYAGDSLEVANSFNKDIDIGTDQVDSGSCDYELDASDGQGLVSVLKGILDELKEIRRNTDNILKCKEITLQEVRALEGILSVCGGAGKLQGTGNVGGSTIGPVGHRRTASTDTLVDLMNGKA